MSEKRKLVSNLLKQNCYILDFRPPYDEKKDYLQDKYTELVENADWNGITFQFVEKDYPITAEYVQSFLAGSDYRLDYANSVGLPARGINLGDVTNIMEILSKDTTELSQLNKDYLAKCEQILKNQREKKPAEPNEDKPNKEKEVK